MTLGELGDCFFILSLNRRIERERERESERIEREREREVRRGPGVLVRGRDTYVFSQVTINGSWYKLFKHYGKNSSGHIGFEELEYVVYKELVRAATRLKKRLKKKYVFFGYFSRPHRRLEVSRLEITPRERERPHSVEIPRCGPRDALPHSIGETVETLETEIRVLCHTRVRRVRR